VTLKLSQFTKIHRIIQVSQELPGQQTIRMSIFPAVSHTQLKPFLRTRSC